MKTLKITPRKPEYVDEIISIIIKSGLAERIEMVDDNKGVSTLVFDASIASILKDEE